MCFWAIGCLCPGSGQQAVPGKEDGRSVRAEPGARPVSWPYPEYLYDAGLQSFGDIQHFAAALNDSIYGIEPGAAANRLVLGMIQGNAFGLGHFKLVESSCEQGGAGRAGAGRLLRPVSCSCSSHGSLIP